MVSNMLVPSFFLSRSLGPLQNLDKKNITQINPLRRGSFVIMRSVKRTYIGKILDIYKQSSGRHGSVDIAESTTGLSYLSLEVYLPFRRVRFS